MSCSPKPDAPVEACGCGLGIAPATPREVHNRFGLSAIRYRIGTYADFKHSMLAGLSASRYPSLAGLRTRSPDDFSLGLIDAVACAADVLSFYQERLANESYLRTATERVSLQEMGKLIGYRLRPGVAAETWLAFALESPRTPPPTMPPEPGSFVTGIPTSLTLEPGLKVQSVPGQGEKPQTFETLETIEARPEWSVMHALPDHDVVPGFGATHTWLAGVDTQLKSGDALLFVGAEFPSHPSSPRWDMRIVTEVQPDPEARRTRVAWRERLDSVSASALPAVAPMVYALRQRASVFGHNAPDWPGLTDEYKAAYLGLERRDQLTQGQREEWPQFDIHGTGTSGSGIHVRAQVAPMEAAEALRKVLKAEGVVEVRRGVAAVSAFGAAAGAVLEKVAAVPGEVGKGAMQAAALVPAAVGQVAEVVMAPVRWLVEHGITDLQNWITSAVPGGQGMAAVLNTIAGLFNQGLGTTLSTTNGFPPANWSNVPTGMPAPLNLNGKLDELARALLGVVNNNGTVLTKGALQFIQDEVDALKASGESLRRAGAGVVGAAMSSTAGAAYAALIEAELNVSPRLPYATAEQVCNETMRASGQALAALPDFVVAMALSDPRAGLVLIATMADLDAAYWSRHLSVQQAFETAAGRLLTHTGGPQALGPVEMGQACRQVLDSLVATSSPQPLRDAVNRMREAAAVGVRRAHLALQKRCDELRATPDARQFIGHLSNTVSLDRVYPGVLVGSYTLLQTRRRTQLFEVRAVSETSRSEYGISGKSTVLRLPADRLGPFAQQVRETSVFMQSELLARARTPLTLPVSGSLVEVAGAVGGLAAKRRLIVQGQSVQTGERIAHQAVLLDATVQPDRTTLHIDPPLPTPLQRASTLVFGNVALATHGETVAQILGAGDASQSFQRFELKRLPLTHRSASNESGADSEIKVRVGDVEWTEKTTLYGTGPQDRAYVLSTDEHGRNWLSFGDGVRGARLPSGVNNVRASYRQGAGRGGNVPADRLTQLMTRPPGLKSVSNPAAALGGADPELPAQARASMPLGTRTLGRAVSLRDYEDFALAFTGIAKARARLLTLAGGPTIVLTVAGQGGDPLPRGSSIWLQLWDALKASGDPHVKIDLLSYQASTFRLGLKVKCEPTYALAPLLAAVEAALRAHFSFEAREMEQPVLQSEVVAVAHTVPGVVAIDLDLLYGGTWSPLQMTPDKHTRLLARALRTEAGSPQPSELLTLATTPFDRLQEM